MKALSLVALTILCVLSTPIQAQDVDRLTRQLGVTSRPEADRTRDFLRKPAQVLTFLGIKEGMTVMDLVAADGYYTEVLSIAVGRNGKVYMHNPPASVEGKTNFGLRSAIEKRLSNDRMSNVEPVIRNFDDLGIPADSVDAAIIALEFHEFSESGDPGAEAQFLQAIKTVLKPGGILGIVEHAGNADGTAARLHRSVDAEVIASAEAAGFELLATSDVLRNPKDDRTRSVFDPSVQGITDRFVLKLQKPL